MYFRGMLVLRVSGLRGSRFADDQADYMRYSHFPVLVRCDVLEGDLGAALARRDIMAK
jgi:hypothetical protein